MSGSQLTHNEAIRCLQEPSKIRKLRFSFSYAMYSAGLFLISHELQLLINRKLQMDKPHIYMELSNEDPDAIHSCRRSSPHHWCSHFQDRNAHVRLIPMPVTDRLDESSPRSNPIASKEHWPLVRIDDRCRMSAR